MSLCPESGYRSNLNDEEFWARVAANVGVYVGDLFEQEEDECSEKDLERCTICGSYGACEYDSEGRPLIHLEDDKYV